MEDDHFNLLELAVNTVQVQGHPPGCVVVSGRIFDYQNNSEHDAFNTLLQLAETSQSRPVGSITTVLVLGQAGIGKTFYGRSMYQALVKGASTESGNIVPVHINLPDVQFGARSVLRLEEIVGKRLCHSQQPAEFRLVIILDGYDEINHEIDFKLPNELFGSVGALVFIITQPHALPAAYAARRDLLSTTNSASAYLEYELLHFSANERNQYISCTCKDVLTAEKNREWFDKIPDLGETCNTPLMLSLVIPILPDLVAKLEAQSQDAGASLRQLCATQTGIFDEIIQHWTRARLEKRKSKVPSAFCIYWDQLPRYCLVYMQNLAAKLVDRNSGFLAERGFLALDTMDPVLLEPAADPQLMADWANMQGLLHAEPDLVTLIRSCCLLSYNIDRQEYRFCHRSIAEHCAAREILESYRYFNAHLNDLGHRPQPVRENAQMLRKLADRVNSDGELEEILLSIIRSSASTAGLSDLAATALTVLARSKYNFSGKNFQNISAPYADLGSSCCAGTDFRGADMRYVNFTQAYLVNARFDGADLEGARFGEEAQIRIPEHEFLQLKEYLTPGGSSHLLCLMSHSKYRLSSGRDDETQQVPSAELDNGDYLYQIDFDTGRHVRTIHLDEDSCILYSQLVQDRHELITWPHNIPNSRGNGIKWWDLVNGTSTQTVPVSHFFPHLQRGNFSVTIDNRGNWIAWDSDPMLGQSSDKDTSHHVLINILGTAQRVPLKYDGGSSQLLGIKKIKFLPSGSSTQAILAIWPVLKAQGDQCHPLILLSLQGDASGDIQIMRELQIDLGEQVNLVDFGGFFMEPSILQVPGPDSRTPRFIDTVSGHSLTLPRHALPVARVVHTRDGSLIATGDYSGNVYVWRVLSSQRVVHMRTYSRELDNAPILAFHPENLMLACGLCENQTLKFWKLDEMGDAAEVATTASDAVTSRKQEHLDRHVLYLCVSPSSCNVQYIATVSCTDRAEKLNEGSARHLFFRLWNCVQWRRGGHSPVDEHMGRMVVSNLVMRVAVTCHGQQFVVLGTERLDWDPILCAEDNHRRAYECILQIYNERAQIVLKTVLISKNEWVNQKDICLRSGLFFSMTNDQDECFPQANVALAFDPNTIQLWKYRTRTQSFCVTGYLYASLEPVTDSERLERYALHRVAFIDFSMDGKWVVGAGNDCVVRLWNLEDLAGDKLPNMTVNVEAMSGPRSVQLDSSKLQVFWASKFGVDIYQLAQPSSPVKFEFVEALCMVHIEPLHLTLVGGQDSKLRIFQDSEIVLEIPLWFPVQCLAVANVDNPKLRELSLKVVVGGFQKNLTSLLISIHETEFKWAFGRVYEGSWGSLFADNCNISQAIHLSQWRKRVLQSNGAVGEPCPLPQRHITKFDLCKELPGTAVSETPDFFGLHTISNEVWGAAYAARMPRTRIQMAFRLLGVRHLFLIVQGRKRHQLFQTRADLHRDPITNRALIDVKTYDSLKEISEDLSTFEGDAWEISPQCGNLLLDNIRRDQQLTWEYDFFLHNCWTWCYFHLPRVGVPVTFSDLTGFSNAKLIVDATLILMLLLLVTWKLFEAILHQMQFIYLSVPNSQFY